MKGDTKDIILNSSVSSYMILDAKLGRILYSFMCVRKGEGVGGLFLEIYLNSPCESMHLLVIDGAFEVKPFTGGELVMNDPISVLE